MTGDFWSTADGHAGLTLKSAGATETVISPNATLEVNGSWSPVAGGQTTTFSLKPRLPLIVGEGSNVALDLPWPAAPGRYRLHLEASGWDVPARDVEVEIGSAPGPVTLLPIRADALPAAALSQQVQAGRVSLGWRLLDRPEGDVTVRLRLVDAAGQEIDQDDQSLGGTSDLVSAWRPGQIVTTTHSINLPGDALGVYSVQASLLRSNDPTTYLFLTADGTPVETLTLPFVIRPEQTATTALPPTASLAEFGEGVYLLDSDIRPPAQPGQPFEISADWTTAAPLDANYTIFAHLVDADGQIIAQQDQQPLGGRYPTTVWAPGKWSAIRSASRCRPKPRGKRSACGWGYTTCIRSFACRASDALAAGKVLGVALRIPRERRGRRENKNLCGLSVLRGKISTAGAMAQGSDGLHQRPARGAHLGAVCVVEGQQVRLV